MRSVQFVDVVEVMCAVMVDSCSSGDLKQMSSMAPAEVCCCSIRADERIIEGYSLSTLWSGRF